MPDPSPSHSLWEAAGAWLAGSGVALLAALKIFDRFKLTQRDAVRVDADIDVLTGLRTELKRLGEQNGALAGSLNELQVEVAALRGTNASLTTQVESLREENRTLTTEVGALRAENATLRQTIGILSDRLGAFHAQGTSPGV